MSCACGKIRYQSRRGAQQAAQAVRMSDRSRHLRVYPCPVAIGIFHVGHSMSNSNHTAKREQKRKAKHYQRYE